MNIVFMGTPAFAVPMLEALARRYTVSLVVSQPDALVGRKQVLEPTPVKVAAQALGIPVFQPERIGSDVEPIQACQPDLIVTVAYGQFLPNRVLDIPRLDAINVHASLLPKLRGGAPVQRAIERGHTKTGISIIRMVKKMDAGPILCQKALSIEDDDTSETLFKKLAPLGVEALIETVDQLQHGPVEGVPQDDDEATFAPIIKKSEARIHWNQSARIIERKVRAFYPQPNLVFSAAGKRIKVLEATTTTKPEGTSPGTVCEASQHRVVIACLEDALVLQKVQLEGKKPMAIHAFMNGAGRTLLVPQMQL